MASLLAIGTAGAAGLLDGGDVLDGSLTGRDVKNKSLTRADFRGSVRGRRGPTGPTGPTGAAGATGPLGAASGDLRDTFPAPRLAVIPAVRVSTPHASANVSSPCPFVVVPGGDTAVPVHWTSEEFDTTNSFAPPSPPCADSEKLSVTKSGIYQVSSQVIWTANSSGSRFLGIYFCGGSRSGLLTGVRDQALQSGFPEQSVSTIIGLNAGESICVEVRQSSGTDQGLIAEGRSHFAMAWLGYKD